VIGWARAASVTTRQWGRTGLISGADRLEKVAGLQLGQARGPALWLDAMDTSLKISIEDDSGRLLRFRSVCFALDAQGTTQ
jgi:hypothetical protein